MADKELLESVKNIWGLISGRTILSPWVEATQYEKINWPTLWDGSAKRLSNFNRGRELKEAHTILESFLWGNPVNINTKKDWMYSIQLDNPKNPQFVYVSQPWAKNWDWTEIAPAVYTYWGGNIDRIEGLLSRLAKNPKYTPKHFYLLSDDRYTTIRA